MIYLKVVIIGDGGIGKTAMVLRYTKDMFQEDYKVTIGVQFATQVEQINEETVKLQIWDTAGEERFSFLMPIYYRGAQGAILVFDLTKRRTFDHLDNWAGLVKKVCGDIPLILVGNKYDLIDQRRVDQQEAIDYAKKNGYAYFETSAKTGVNVREAFQILAGTCTEKIIQSKK
ncbi:MAG: Rab family GTPase [Candidatus Ranarchaeia archaeon]